MHSTEEQALASLRRLDEHTPVDLSLASVGYLTGPRGSLRFIHRLAPIASDTAHFRASVFWDMEMTNPLGWCAAPFRRIVLAGFLFWEEPAFIREVWAHECTHLYPRGRSEIYVRDATWDLYGHLIRQLAVL